MTLWDLRLSLAGNIKVRIAGSMSKFIYEGLSYYADNHLNKNVMSKKIVMMYQKENYLEIVLDK